MDHVTRVRPIKVSPPKDGLEALLGGKDVDATNLPKMPDAQNYFAIPESKPHLRSFVRSFEWNCVTREIEMLIDETPAFSAYDWLISINKKKQENQDKPLGELQQDCLTLILMDQAEREVARIRFRGLELISHRCGLSTPEDGATFGVEPSDEFVPVRHLLILKYQSGECSNNKLQYHEPEDFDSDPDKEWSETELEIEVADKPESE